MQFHTGVVAVVCCLLLFALPVGAVVGQPAGDSEAAAGVDTPTDAVGPTAATAPIACFPPSGYGFTIGTLGPQIDMIVHLSLLTNLGGPGTLGIELAGAVDDTEPIIELRTGAVFHGVTDVNSFLANPFGLFSIAYEYRFQLPMFENGIDYETTEPPISGPVGESRC